MNPRPLGYEPYDLRLWCLGPSLAGAVTSADRTDPISFGRLRLPRFKPSLAGAATSADTTDPISLGRLRLPRLKLSRRVRLQIGLQNRLVTSPR